MESTEPAQVTAPRPSMIHYKEPGAIAPYPQGAIKLMNAVDALSPATSGTIQILHASSNGAHICLNQKEYIIYSNMDQTPPFNSKVITMIPEDGRVVYFSDSAMIICLVDCIELRTLTPTGQTLTAQISRALLAKAGLELDTITAGSIMRFEDNHLIFFFWNSLDANSVILLFNVCTDSPKSGSVGSLVACKREDVRIHAHVSFGHMSCFVGEHSSGHIIYYGLDHSRDRAGEAWLIDHKGTSVPPPPPATTASADPPTESPATKKRRKHKKIVPACDDDDESKKGASPTPSSLATGLQALSLQPTPRKQAKFFEDDDETGGIVRVMGATEGQCVQEVSNVVSMMTDQACPAHLAVLFQNNTVCGFAMTEGGHVIMQTQHPGVGALHFFFSGSALVTLVTGKVAIISLRPAYEQKYYAPSPAGEIATGSGLAYLNTIVYLESHAFLDLIAKNTVAVGVNGVEHWVSETRMSMQQSEHKSEMSELTAKYKEVLSASNQSSKTALSRKEELERVQTENRELARELKQARADLIQNAMETTIINDVSHEQHEVVLPATDTEKEPQKKPATEKSKKRTFLTDIGCDAHQKLVPVNEIPVTVGKRLMSGAISSAQLGVCQELIGELLVSSGERENRYQETIAALRKEITEKDTKLASLSDVQAKFERFKRDQLVAEKRAREKKQKQSTQADTASPSPVPGPHVEAASDPMGCSSEGDSMVDLTQAHARAMADLRGAFDKERTKLTDQVALYKRISDRLSDDRDAAKAQYDEKVQTLRAAKAKERLDFWEKEATLSLTVEKLEKEVAEKEKTNKELNESHMAELRRMDTLLKTHIGEGMIAREKADGLLKAAQKETAAAVQIADVRKEELRMKETQLNSLLVKLEEDKAQQELSREQTRLAQMLQNAFASAQATPPPHKDSGTPRPTSQPSPVDVIDTMRGANRVLHETCLRYTTEIAKLKWQLAQQQQQSHRELVSPSSPPVVPHMQYGNPVVGPHGQWVYPVYTPPHISPPPPSPCAPDITPLTNEIAQLRQQLATVTAEKEALMSALVVVSAKRHE